MSTTRNCPYDESWNRKLRLSEESIENPRFRELLHILALSLMSHLCNYLAEFSRALESSTMLLIVNHIGLTVTSKIICYTHLYRIERLWHRNKIYQIHVECSQSISLRMILWSVSVNILCPKMLGSTLTTDGYCQQALCCGDVKALSVVGSEYSVYTVNARYGQ